jgi:proteasome accessory factor A
VIFDLPGHDSLQRVPMLEPLRGGRESVGDLIDASPTAADLMAALASR